MIRINFKPRPAIIARSIWMVSFCAAAMPGARGAITAEQREFFESKIRPVLAQDCYECHNSDGKAKGGLILDHRDALVAGGDSGAVIVKGNPGASLLMRAIRHETDDLQMPKAGVKLDEEILANFAKWIAMGAPDPRDSPPSKSEIAADTSWDAIMERRKQWWSYQTITEPAPPEVQNADWAKHPVDRFIFAGMDEAGLEPATPAEKRVLIRRLSYVLTGLPPTPEEVETFLGDAEPGARGRLVDRLLDSPRFGERWARHWMDWIRYAESHGSEGDPAIVNAHHYRDYLIRALNADVPYDQLVREHVAGDLLEEPRINSDLGINESAIGPAHWRMVFHGFTPTDALDERVRFTDDQINVFTKAFLGLTVSCARCHDHKFDAISQADYYALFGILSSARPGRVAIDLPGKRLLHRDRLAEMKPDIRGAVAEAWLEAVGDLEKKLIEMEKPEETNPALEPWFAVRGEDENFRAAWARQVSSWEKRKAEQAAHESRDYRKRWDLSRPDEYAQWFRHGDALKEKPSGAGAFAIGTAGAPAIAGIFPAGVYSHELSAKLGVTLASRDEHLDGKYELWLRVMGDGGAMSRYVVQNFPRNGTVYPVTTLKNGWDWQVYKKLDYWDGDEIHIELTTAQDAPLLAKNSARSWFGFREAVLVEKGAESPPASSREEWAPLFDLAEQETPNSAKELAKVYHGATRLAVDAWRDGRMTDGQALFLDAILKAGLLPNKPEEMGAAGKMIATYRKLEEEIPVATRVPGLFETVAFDQPLFDRGDHKKPLDPVPRRFLEAIDDTPYDTPISGRRELAEDLIRDDNPFTRRIIVNRLWHHVFGNGLVTTTDNFGRMGTKPSHPELLDYLATRFAEEGWSMKKMIRLLVTSKTFALSNEASPRAKEVDPGNALLSHAPVRRLEAEAIRDSLLAVSGELRREEMYGAPVVGDAPRRSVYVRVIRNQMDPFLTTFDAPVPASAVGRRDVTNVPGQSLTMLNSAFVRSLAGKWGDRVEAETGGDAEKVKVMWETAFGRKPADDERKNAMRFMADLRRQQEGDRVEFKELEGMLVRLKSKLRKEIDPVRARLLAERGVPEKGESGPPVAPLGWWKFDGDLRDSAGGLHGEVKGDAYVEDGALVVKGNGYVATSPLVETLKSKTLEALVQLETLAQGGGGVVTVQDLRGGAFDSVVYAERAPRRWMAGSNHSHRTLPFKGKDETEAVDTPVWVAIAYYEDGTIRGYRNGEPYGIPIRKSDAAVFDKGDAQVVFGLRHGTSPSGNRTLKGRILEARLYDRALTAAELAASAEGRGNFVSERQFLEALDEAARGRVTALKDEIEKLEKRIQRTPKPAGDEDLWGELAHMLFNLKEFVYLR